MSSAAPILNDLSRLAPTLTDLGDSTPPASSTSTRPARIGAIVLCSLIGLHMSGTFDATATYSITVLAGVLFCVAGIAINRPKPSWPWLTLMSTGLIWTISSSFGESDANFANLTSSRRLLADLFALPGYVVFGVALVGLLRVRRQARDLTLLLDGVVLVFGAALAAHHTLIGPTLSLPDSWLPARLVVAAYPTASLILLGIAAQLAFVSGRRSTSFSLLLVGVSGLVIGDLLWAFGEIGTLQVSTRALDVPYLLAPSFLAIALLHPDVRNATTRSTAIRPTDTPVARHLAVSSALIAPTALVIFPGAITPLAIVLSVGLCASSAARVALAMQAEDRSRAILLYRATHDDLTDLPSRPLLVEEIGRRLSIAGGESVSLLFIDLDHFKNVNDLMGHQAGDELLMEVAARIVNVVRDDDLVARISGDEFVVVTGGLTIDAVRRMADRIRSVLTRPFDLTVGEVFVTASVGVSRSQPLGPKSASELLQEADTAMYESKIGRNDTTVFDASMQERATRRMEIERLLRHSSDSPEFTTSFQPIIDSAAHRVVGFEALLRWTVDGEAISPGEFIPIAEDSGLIVPIGAFVLDEACRQAAWWRKNIPGGEDLYVSVNLSPRQVIAPNIVDTVASALTRHELPSSALWLEITETVMTEDTATTAAAMTGLRMLGVRLALDDFGTGYSSLSGLQYLPVSRLKIDRRFIMGLGSNPANDKLVRCITAVAASFDLDVVAEGVETKEQLALLHGFDCSLIQGWLYSPAVPAQDVPAAFAQHDRRTPKRRHKPSTVS